MNIHHLELFYYVARHGGISEAVRNIPYGIQQPAVSIQIIHLEETLGTKLFNRRPFQLTPAGHRLYAFIEPFFRDLGRVAEEITERAARFIRLGATSTILRNHFPGLIRAAQQKVPGLKFSLHDGIEPQLIRWLESNEIDLAVTVTQTRPPAGIKVQPLLRLPLGLLVREESPVRSAAELWKRDKIEEPLICLPPAESITRHFQQRLAGLRVEWFGTIVVSSLDLIETYVLNGFGIGLSVLVPGTRTPAGLRWLPLQDFEPIRIGALWNGKATPVVRMFVEVLLQRAQELAGSPENDASGVAPAFQTSTGKTKGRRETAGR
jgi:DNA-binding transcriptional LysR family regulator